MYYDLFKIDKSRISLNKINYFHEFALPQPGRLHI